MLLVKPNYKQQWDIPSGYVEPDETLLEACKREVREELGFDPDVRQLLGTDWAPNDGEGDKLLFILDGGTLTPDRTDALQLADDELKDWAFKERSELADVLPPRLQRRIGQAIDAWHSGSHVYLEQGTPPAENRPRKMATEIG